jgi:hypothetical protein
VTDNKASNSKVKTSWQKVLIFLGGIIGFACLLFVGWLIWTFKDYEPFSSRTYQPVPTDIHQISAIEGNANIRLPPSAHEIYAYTTGFREISIMVRFSMDASELAEFMGSTLCEQSLVEIPQELYVQEVDDDILQLRLPKPGGAVPVTSRKFSGDPDWWLLHQAQYAEECYGKNKYSHQHILIDMSEQDVYIVYVSNSNQ